MRSQTNYSATHLAVRFQAVLAMPDGAHSDRKFPGVWMAPAKVTFALVPIIKKDVWISVQRITPEETDAREESRLAGKSDREIGI